MIPRKGKVRNKLTSTNVVIIIILTQGPNSIKSVSTWNALPPPMAKRSKRSPSHCRAVPVQSAAFQAHWKTDGVCTWGCGSNLKQWALASDYLTERGYVAKEGGRPTRLNPKMMASSAPWDSFSELEGMLVVGQGSSSNKLLCCFETFAFLMLCQHMLFLWKKVQKKIFLGRVQPSIIGFLSNK